MASTKPRRDPFDELRDAFHARLKTERVQFVTLSAALAQAEEDPQRIFADLQYRAHKLQGGAAIFEVADIAQAAGALEAAAVSAAAQKACNSDERVWSALEHLVDLMGNIGVAPAAGQGSSYG
jgi:chemotaxis protein histidine kinase CheA